MALLLDNDSAPTTWPGDTNLAIVLPIILPQCGVWGFKEPKRAKTHLSIAVMEEWCSVICYMRQKRKCHLKCVIWFSWKRDTNLRSATDDKPHAIRHRSVRIHEYKNVTIARSKLTCDSQRVTRVELRISVGIVVIWRTNAQFLVQGAVRRQHAKSIHA